MECVSTRSLERPHVLIVVDFFRPPFPLRTLPPSIRKQRIADMQRLVAAASPSHSPVALLAHAATLSFEAALSRITFADACTADGRRRMADAVRVEVAARAAEYGLELAEYGGLEMGRVEEASCARVNRLFSSFFRFSV